MEQKGDVQSSVHMDIYLTFAVQKHNMITRRNGSTIFEMKPGRPSRTVCDLIAEPAEADTKHLQLPVRQHIALARHRSEDLLEESRAVKRLGMTLMQERDEILVKVTGESGKMAHEVIELLPLKDLMFDMSAEPLNILSVCDSMGTLFIRLVNNGFRVEKYYMYSVELDPVSREVVDGICDAVDMSLGHVVMEITEAEIAELEHLHMLMATPEFQP